MSEHNYSGPDMSISPSVLDTVWGTTNVVTIPNIITANNTGWYGAGPYSINWPVQPNAAQLNQEIIESLFQRMVTTVKENEKVIVCVDDDVADSQVRELAETLKDHKLSGIVVRGARAGTGFAGDTQVRFEDTRVDILARLGELWEQRPDMKLTELLSWYHGERMEDKDFASACEVHFTKVTE